MTDPARRSAGRTAALVLGIVALLGLAAAGGTLIRGSSTETTAGQAFPYALVGAVTGLVVLGVGLIAIRLARPGSLRLRAWELLALAFLAAAFGALVAVALTPSTPAPEDVSPLDESDIDRRSEQAGEISSGTRAGPVDRDRDGVADVDSNGDPIIGYDSNGDGRLDGYLQPCPDSTPRPAPRPGYTPFDADCDGTVDEWLAFDPDRLLETNQAYDPRPLEPIPQEARAERADSQGASGKFGGVLLKLLLILVVIVVATAIIVYLVRRREPEAAPPEVELPPPAPTPPVLDVSRSIEDSLDAVLHDPDPRRAICAAYGRMLDGLAQAGFPKRVEEGPAEHIARCLASARIDAAPVQELLDLFAFARFSSHPVTEAHRAAAVRAMRAVLASTPQTVPG